MIIFLLINLLGLDLDTCFPMVRWGQICLHHRDLMCYCRGMGLRPPVSARAVICSQGRLSSFQKKLNFLIESTLNLKFHIVSTFMTFYFRVDISRPVPSHCERYKKILDYFRKYMEENLCNGARKFLKFSIK